MKQLHSDIKFQPTITLSMDYSLESVSFLDTGISIKDVHISTSPYCKPTDNFTMLHFSISHPKHIKEAIPYRQALHIHRICSDEEECDRHLKMLKDTLIRMGYNVQLIERQLQRATMKNRNDLLQRQTQDMTDRAPFIVQHFPGAERLRHVLCRIQFVMDDHGRLTEIIPTPPILTVKQPPNLKRSIARSKLPSLQDNIDHNCTQPCHSNLCKTHQIIEMGTTIT
eukprot:g43838.t1